MPQALMIPLITTIGGSLMSGLMGKAFGGGKEKEEKAAAAGPAAAARRLFSPEQITQATDRYSSQNKAKWGQILSNMGAGGGTGGVDPTAEIGSQATRMAAQLGGLTTESGYGDNPMSNLDAILKGVEGGITPKYSLY